MADTVDESKLQAPRAWTHLMVELGVRTPPKLLTVNVLSKLIREASGAKRRKRG